MISFTIAIFFIEIPVFKANSIDPDQGSRSAVSDLETSRAAVSDLGLNCS